MRRFFQSGEESPDARFPDTHGVEARPDEVVKGDAREVVVTLVLETNLKASVLKDNDTWVELIGRNKGCVMVPVGSPRVEVQ